MIDAPGLVKALADARDTAYKGVVKPVEGTILTVGQGTGGRGRGRAGRDAGPDRDPGTMRAGRRRVGQPYPELLPVLKQAGVVDAGGKGYSLFWRECCAISTASRWIHRSPPSNRFHP